MQMSAARLVFEVPGDPRGKGRHRSFLRKGKVVHAADAPTESYEAQIQWWARQAMGKSGLHELLEGPLWMHITAFTRPSKEQQKAMLKDPLGEHFSTVKPDFDNVAKVVADALNGVVYRDDAVIADGRVVKRLDELTRLVVSIGQLERS